MVNRRGDSVGLAMIYFPMFGSSIMDEMELNVSVMATI